MHDLTINQDGSASFVSAREIAWHRLGTVLNVDGMTADQALTEAKLKGWDVRKVPAMALIGDQAIEVEGKWAIVRTNPVTREAEPNGGIVGNQWTPFQNEEAADFLTAICDQSGAVIQTAGALGSYGQEVFVTMKLPEGIMIGGRDCVDCYVSVFNNHIGTGSLLSTVSPVRTVCRNTQRANIARAKSSFKHPHTTGLKGAVEAARKDLQMTWKYLEGFQAEADLMIAEAMTAAEFDAFLTDAVTGPRPVVGQKIDGGDRDATEKDIEKWEQEYGTLRHLFTDADTQENCRNTRWAAYQSVVEYLDWYVPAAGKTDADKATARALRQATNLDVARSKAEVFDLLRVGA